MEFKQAHRLENLHVSGTRVVFGKCAELAAQGIPVTALTLGQPDFDTPQYIIDACKKALDEGKTRYTDGSGIQELKEAVCQKLEKENGLHYTPSEISVTTGVLFILAAFFSPIVTIVSSAATCGALVYVGYLMMSEASEIDWSDVSQGFPAFMIVAGVPFTYSISAGIGLGFIAYVIVALFKGEASKIKPLMWIAALAFLVYFFVA